MRRLRSVREEREARATMEAEMEEIKRRLTEMDTIDNAYSSRQLEAEEIAERAAAAMADALDAQIGDDDKAYVLLHLWSEYESSWLTLEKRIAETLTIDAMRRCSFTRTTFLGLRMRNRCSRRWLRWSSGMIPKQPHWRRTRGRLGKLHCVGIQTNLQQSLENISIPRMRIKSKNACGECLKRSMMPGVKSIVTSHDDDGAQLRDQKQPLQRIQSIHSCSRTNTRPSNLFGAAPHAACHCTEFRSRRLRNPPCSA